MQNPDIQLCNETIEYHAIGAGFDPSKKYLYIHEVESVVKEYLKNLKPQDLYAATSIQIRETRCICILSVPRPTT